MPSVLTPFVRSDTVGAILAEVFIDPAQELTIAELARRTGVLPAVAHREIGRLVDGGVLTDRRQGNNRLVRVNANHPLYTPMADIITATYGPVPVLRELLQTMPGIENVFIFGSWAARRMGEPGPSPRDVDVLVVGDMDLDSVIQTQETARERLRLDVKIHRVDPDAWAHPEANAFLATVASRPLIPIVEKKDSDA